MAKVPNSNPRWVALQVILSLVDRGRSLDDIFASEWFLNLPMSARDQAMSRELSLGLCRWYFILHPLLNQRLQKPLRARDQDVEIVLLLGLYQLLVMETGAASPVTFVAAADGQGITAFQIDDTGTVQNRVVTADTDARYLGGVSDMVTLTVGGQNYLYASSAQDHGLSG